MKEGGKPGKGKQKIKRVFLSWAEIQNLIITGKRKKVADRRLYSSLMIVSAQFNIGVRR